ncbi:MAG: RIP metalloprotease RseP [Ignavibacteria bacterium]|nr:RIP metalloprotease RseP [Ignavibacteria bacterium]
MELISTIFYFLIVIGILVFIHEFGHFIAARACGMRAEVFALGIGFRLFGYNKKTGFTFGKLPADLELGEVTDYRVCAFPIGGYVKIAGMIDESMDKKFVEKEPKPWEYRSKPVWKRMIVITAGVAMNIFLAFAIFYALTLMKGKNLTDTTTIGYVSKNSIAYQSGILEGDEIVSINNNEVKYWEDIQNQLYIDNLGESLTLNINRASENIIIKIPKDEVGILANKNFGIYPSKIIPHINSVLQGKPAKTIGIQKGDIISGFAGKEIVHSQQLIDLIKVNTNKETEIEWLRDGNEMSATITPSADSTIGIEISSQYEGPIEKTTYNIITAFPKAFDDMFYYGGEVFFKVIAKIVTGEIPFKKAIGGPVKIAQASAQSAEGGFFTFIGFLALLSMSLAIINILPFPALDGGHFLLLLYEGVVRKPVPYKVQIVLQNVGFILLLAFMLYVIYNDIISIK